MHWPGIVGGALMVVVAFMPPPRWYDWIFGTLGIVIVAHALHTGGYIP